MNKLNLFLTFVLVTLIVLTERNLLIATQDHSRQLMRQEAEIQQIRLRLTFVPDFNKRNRTYDFREF